jgi:hypothetical protein
VNTFNAASPTGLPRGGACGQGLCVVEVRRVLPQQGQGTGRALVLNSGQVLLQGLCGSFGLFLRFLEIPHRGVEALLGFAETVEAEDGLAARRVTAC